MSRAGQVVLTRPLIRRTGTIVALICVTALVFAAATVVLSVSTPGFAVRRRWPRPVRIAALACAYATTELAGLVIASGQWLRWRAGRDGVRYRVATAGLLSRALTVMRRSCERFGALHATFAPLTDPRDPGMTLPPGPLVVAARHSGPGGAFLLVQILMADHDRTPRLVLKNILVLDPLLDVLVGRLPHRFVDPDPHDEGRTAAAIGDLARGLGPAEALVIFPEGGAFTARRRIRVIRRLRRHRLAERARRAEALHHVLPPRPHGLFAAIDAAPGATVVFVAHSGLDHLTSASAVARALPLRQPVRFAWWPVPAGDVPALEDPRLEWLDESWSRIDKWIGRAVAP